MMKAPALGAIWVYQNFISPYKGFSCAHRVVHGGDGCSGFAKTASRNLTFSKPSPRSKPAWRTARRPRCNGAGNVVAMKMSMTAVVGANAKASARTTTVMIASTTAQSAAPATVAAVRISAGPARAAMIAEISKIAPRDVIAATSEDAEIGRAALAALFSLCTHSNRGSCDARL